MTWDPLGDVEANAQKNNEEIVKRNITLNSLYYKTFSTDAGKQVLKDLKNEFLDQQCIPSGTGLFDSVVWGLRREGQNDVVRMIVSRITKAIEEEYGN